MDPQPKVRSDVQRSHWGGWLVCLRQNVYDEEITVDLLVTFNLDVLIREVGGLGGGA